MSVVRVVSTAPLAAFFVLLVACGGGGDGHPSPAADGTPPVPAESTGQPQNGKICEPGASEICFLADSSESLSSACPESYRFCASDGTRWHACGDFAMTADGHAIPPDD